MFRVQPSLRAGENSPVHRRDAPLRRHTKLIRTVNRQREQQYRRGCSQGLRSRHPFHSSTCIRSDRFYNRFTNSPESPRARRFFPPQTGFTTVYRTSHYPPLRLANSSFPGRVARVHEGGGIHEGRRWVLSRRRSRRNAVIDRARRGRLWSPRGIGILTLLDDEGYMKGI